MKDKICSTCQITKDISCFHKNKTKLDGLSNICKPCKSLYYYGVKKENTRKMLLQQQLKHCPQCQEIKSISLFFNNKSSANKLSTYCKTCSVIKNNQYYQQHKPKLTCQTCTISIARGKFCPECRIFHKKEYRKLFERKQRQQIEYRLKNNISRSVREMLLLRNKSKRNRAIANYLKYSVTELVAHLESQFEPWMNWDNYGTYNKNVWNDQDINTWTWQIDHIVPHSYFNYTSLTEEAFQQCWDLNNLRPLSAKANIHKSNYYGQK